MEKKCPQCMMMVPEESKICPCCGYSDQTLKKTIIKSLRKHPLIYIAILFIIFIPSVRVASDLTKKWERGKETDAHYLNNLKVKEILLRRITMVHSKWQLIKEKEIEGGQMLVAAQNPVNPVLKPIWLIKKGVIYSINGAAKMLTDDFQLCYDLTPSESIDIMEGRKVYKISDSNGKTWNTTQEAMEVLKAHVFITEREAAIIESYEEYLDNPNNSDSEEAIENWVREHNITTERLDDILSMRWSFKSIAEIAKAGYVRVGEKKIIRKAEEIGQPTGKLITKFDVSYKKATAAVFIQVQTDLPDGAPLTFSIAKTGLKDRDTWIGNEEKAIVKNGKAEVTIPLTTHKGNALEDGLYDVEIYFNSFWSASMKNIDPNVKAVVGEFGENLKTPFTDKFEQFKDKFHQEGNQYRTIDFKKRAAFTVP